MMACACRLTEKLCETGIAAAKLLLPACEAVMVHIPALVNVTVLIHFATCCATKV